MILLKLGLTLFVCAFVAIIWHLNSQRANDNIKFSVSTGLATVCAIGLISIWFSSSNPFIRGMLYVGILGIQTFVLHLRGLSIFQIKDRMAIRLITDDIAVICSDAGSVESVVDIRLITSSFAKLDTNERFELVRKFWKGGKIKRSIKMSVDSLVPLQEGAIDADQAEHVLFWRRGQYYVMLKIIQLDASEMDCEEKDRIYCLYSFALANWQKKTLAELITFTETGPVHLNVQYLNAVKNNNWNVLVDALAMDGYLVSNMIDRIRKLQICDAELL